MGKVRRNGPFGQNNYNRKYAEVKRIFLGETFFEEKGFPKPLPKTFKLDENDKTDAAFYENLHARIEKTGKLCYTMDRINYRYSEICRHIRKDVFI